MASNPVIASIKTGSFYFRDSAHWLYNRKATELLEDIIQYSYEFPFQVNKVHDAVVTGATGISVSLGFGTGAYGKSAYGGPDISGASTVSITLPEDPNVVGSLGPISRVSFDLDKAVINPVRTVIAQSIGSHCISLSYSGYLNTKNVFGLPPDYLGTSGEISVQLSFPEPPSRLKITGEANSLYTYETASTGLSLASIQTQHAAGGSLAIVVSDDNPISWSLPGDLLFIEFPYRIISISGVGDLPLEANANKLAIYHDSANSKYYIIDSAGRWTVRTSMLCTATRKVLVRAVAGPSISTSYQGNVIYVEPYGWANAGLFSSPSVNTDLFANLVTFWDGIPAGIKIIGNKYDVIVDQIIDNDIYIKQAASNQYETVTPTEYPVWQEYWSSMIDNNRTIATLNGTGSDYVTGLSVFIEDMTKEYVIDNATQPGTPIVITDLLTTDIDDSEFTNIQFRTKTEKPNRTLLEFNRANNRLYNSTFLKTDSNNMPLVWDYSPGISVVPDYINRYARLHNQYVSLPNDNDYIRQHIRKVNNSTRYCLSMYASGMANIKVRVYEFDNGGTEFTATPSIASATNILEFGPVVSNVVPTKYVVRLYPIANFSLDSTIIIPPVTSFSLSYSTTDIIVEILNGGTALPINIACVQFEASANPTPFSHNYDYALIEYESGNKDYSPRFIASALDNPNNNGFMVLDIVAPDLQDTALPTSNVVKSGRTRAINKYSIRPWAKLHGVNKYIRSSVFSPTRRQFKGEYFALPIIPKANNISFQSDIISLYQGKIGETNTQKFTIIAEDSELNNLADVKIDYDYSVLDNNFAFKTELTTDTNGLAWVTPLNINEEEVLPYAQVSITPIGSTTLTNGELVCLCDSTGSFSQIMQVVSGSPVPITNSNECLYDTVSAPTHVLKLSSVVGAEGLVEYPFIPRFTIDPTDNASCMLSMFSTINNIEVVVPVYSPSTWESNQADSTVRDIITGATITVPSVYSGIVHKSFSSTLTKPSSQKYFDIPYSINPLLASVSVVIPGNEQVSIYRSGSRNNTGLFFYIDYLNRRLYVSSSTIDTISIKYVVHPVKIVGNRIFFSRHVLFFFIKELYNTIQSTALSTQHSNPDLVPEIQSVITAINPLEFPIYIKAHANVSVSAKAQHGTMVRTASLIYSHRTPLI